MHLDSDVTKTSNESMEDVFKVFYNQQEDLRPKLSRKWRNHEAGASHAASHTCGGAWNNSSSSPRPPPRVWTIVEKFLQGSTRRDRGSTRREALYQP